MVQRNLRSACISIRLTDRLLISQSGNTKLRVGVIWEEAGRDGVGGSKEFKIEEISLYYTRIFRDHRQSLGLRFPVIPPLTVYLIRQSTWVLVERGR